MPSRWLHCKGGRGGVYYVLTWFITFYHYHYNCLYSFITSLLQLPLQLYYIIITIGYFGIFLTIFSIITIYKLCFHLLPFIPFVTGAFCRCGWHSQATQACKGKRKLVVSLPELLCYAFIEFLVGNLVEVHVTSVHCIIVGCLVAKAEKK